MRIAIFTESYEPIINGVSVFVRTLRDELASRNHKVFVFAPRFKGHTDGRDDVFRFPSTHTFLMRDYPFPIPFAPALKKVFASLKIDVVHTQTPFLLGVVGARWARQFGVPLVSTNHTLYTEYAHYVPFRPTSVTKAGLVRLMRWYYSGCDAVVAPSDAVRERLRGYGVSVPVEVIRTGVVGVEPLAPDHRAQVRQQYGVGDSDFLLLYVGRIAREKNLAMLLRAFQAVAQSHEGARLLLVGGGPALNETQQFARELNLGDRLRFAGMLQREQLDPIYGAADAFVFPSTTETQGIAICEAMSAGLPVVAVNAGGIPENVQPGVDGFLTEDDPQQFASRIETLITDDAVRRRMASAARANSSNFSIQRMVSDFERFYSTVIEGHAAQVLRA